MPPSTQWGPPLSHWMVEAVQSLGFDKMTPVQAAAIPLLSGNKDVVVEAVTGSGKTLAFILPILVRLGKLNFLQLGQTNSIIVCPTRELAHQTYKVLRSVIDLAPEPSHYRTQLVTGGSNTSTVADIKNYIGSRPHVVVATPGRLLELLRAQHVRMNALDILVLDEADRLLDIGVDQTINKILSLLPKQKRVGLFSATMDADIIKDIIRAGMRNPIKVSVKELGSSSLPDRLLIEYVSCQNTTDKITKALSVLNSADFRKAIVYIPTCTSVTYWYQVYKLIVEKADIYSLHGKLQQAPRLKTLEKFTENSGRSILLTTDVAARGLDIPDVDLVLQLDPPTDPNMFVHRAGRTGRAGKSGLCIVFLLEGLEEGYIDFMAVRKVPILPISNDITPIENYIETVRQWIRSDRSRHDLALRSFLSFIRYYSKHTATSIFRTSELDLIEVGKGFGLLRLPRMPELKNKEIPNQGWLVEPFDLAEWAYVDPQQERARQHKLQSPQAQIPDEIKEAKIMAKKRNAIAWSDKLERKSSAQTRRDKRLKRAIAKKETLESDSEDNDTGKDWKEMVQQRKKSKQSSSGFSFDFSS